MIQARTVGAFLVQLKRDLQRDYSRCWLSGELVECSLSSSGHLYFKLRDSQGSLGCVIWASRRADLEFQPTDGVRVQAFGSLTVFPPRGQLQFVVDHLLPDGQGQYLLALEKLKEKLLAEGLFAQARKKALPFFPRRVGVVTSREGAVWHDIHTTLERRNPAVQLILSPSSVQGQQVVPQLIRALDLLRTRVEVVILARGGGSWEDLMPFNHEELVRYLADYPLPVIAAIGHETDTSLCCQVADQRAPTPTAAAEIVAPPRQQLEAELQDCLQRMLRALQSRVSRQRDGLTTLTQRPCLSRPEDWLQVSRQQLQYWSQRLAGSLERPRRQLQHLEGRLQPRLLEARCGYQRLELERVKSQLLQSLPQRVRLGVQQVCEIRRLLESLSPRKVLSRGYSFCRDESGKVVDSVKGRNARDRMEICLADGRLQCRIDQVFIFPEPKEVPP